MKSSMLMFVAAAATFLGVIGCLPKPDGCQPFSTSCSANGTPTVCSSSQRSTTLPGSIPCSSVGNGALVCCAHRNAIDGKIEFGCSLPEDCIAPSAIDGSSSDASAD